MTQLNSSAGSGGLFADAAEEAKRARGVLRKRRERPVGARRRSISAQQCMGEARYSRQHQQ